MALEDLLSRDDLPDEVRERIRREVTDRKREQEALRESERRLRSVVEDQTEFIVRWLPDTTRTFVNESYCRYFGLDRDEAVGTKFLPLISEEFQKAVRARIGALTPENPVSTGEHRVLRPDGNVGWNVWTDRALFDEEGRLLELQSVGRDITEQKRAEKERRDLEAQVRYSQKLESLGVLAGGVAHDFNNLLGGMLGHADLALSKLPPGNPARSNIERIVQAAERASHLSRQMLAYAGRGQFEFRSTDLNDLVGETLQLLEAAVAKSIRLCARTSEAPALIQADLGQMQQVVMNLVINAAEALGDRPGTVTITTGFETLSRDQERYSRFTATGLDAGRYVFLEVRDDGPGIDDEALSRIFDPFFTTKPLGYGLGLSALLGIVRGHKGGIDVQSEPGKGAAFRLVFPATEAAPRGAKATAAEGRLEGTVLVIDDEEIVREMIREMLTPQGLAVLTAEGGAAGTALYAERSDEIDLIVLDLSMPGMGGDEVLRKIREIAPQVPVILSSGFGKEETVRRLEGQGPTGFIQKPYRLATLLAEVRRCLEGRPPPTR